MARRAVQTVVGEAYQKGRRLPAGFDSRTHGNGHLEVVQTESGQYISAGQFVFRLWSLAAKTFFGSIGRTHSASRQEVFFFGAREKYETVSAPALPIWMTLKKKHTGFPDLENRGVKFSDRSSRPAIRSGERRSSCFSRRARRSPRPSGSTPSALKDAPVVERAVCQYDNTSNGDF